MIVAKNDADLAFALALTRGDEAAAAEHVARTAPGSTPLEVARARRALLVDMRHDGQAGPCEQAELRHLNAWLAKNGRPPVDVRRLVAEIKALEEEHRTWKRMKREADREVGRTGDWRAHRKAVAEASGYARYEQLTDRYRLRAWLRGRIHQRKRSLESGRTEMIGFADQERMVMDPGRGVQVEDYSPDLA